MARYEALRDRLPSLYRPEDDEVAEGLVPLGAEALAEVRAGPSALAHEVRVRSGVLHVLLTAPARVDGLRFAGGVAPGAGYAAELYRFAEPLVTEIRPAVVAAVTDGVAVLPRPLETQRFALALKRRELVTGVLLAVSGALDRLNDEAAEVMQAHWYRYADSGRFSPYVLRSRARAAAPEPAPVPAPADPDVAGFPYIADLGRLASLLALAPWRAQSAETVETYRERIARIVSLYRNGLGTIDALRRMTEAQLPVDATAPPERRDRPFSVEDLAALVTTRLPVLMPGAPDSVVGPLMHWRTQGDTLEPAPPTAYVQAPTGNERNGAARAGVHYAPAAERPLLERFDPTAAGPAVGLAYLDTVPDGATLRLRPAFMSWLAREDGVHAARSEPGEDVPADPAAPGPWDEEADGPAAAVAALVQTADQILWAASGQRQLWRRDGGGWKSALDAGAAIHVLAEDGEDLLLGTQDGLLRVARHPEPGEALAAEPDPSLGGPVHALLRAADGTWWAGTPDGLGPRARGRGVRALRAGGGSRHAGARAGRGRLRRDLRRHRPGAVPAPAGAGSLVLVRRGRGDRPGARVAGAPPRGGGRRPQRAGRGDRPPAGGDRGAAGARRRPVDRHRGRPRPLHRGRVRGQARPPHAAPGVPRRGAGPGRRDRRGPARARLVRHRPRAAALRRPRLRAVP